MRNQCACLRLHGSTNSLRNDECEGQFQLCSRSVKESGDPQSSGGGYKRSIVVEVVSVTRYRAVRILCATAPGSIDERMGGKGRGLGGGCGGRGHVGLNLRFRDARLVQPVDELAPFITGQGAHQFDALFD